MNLKTAAQYLALLTIASTCFAQGLPPRGASAPPPAQSEWTLSRSESSLELVPQLRVRIAPPNRSSQIQRLDMQRASAQEASIGGGQYGVVFNHSMQAYGMLTGEISFRLADETGGEAAAASAGLVGVQRLGSSDYFVARANSPQLLRDALIFLRSTPGVQDAEWVVVYGLPFNEVHSARMALQ